MLGETLDFRPHQFDPVQKSYCWSRKYRKWWSYTWKHFKEVPKFKL